eukprot:1175495-Prymnesium_polylepis.1
MAAPACRLLPAYPLLGGRKYNSSLLPIDTLLAQQRLADAQLECKQALPCTDEPMPVPARLPQRAFLACGSRVARERVWPLASSGCSRHSSIIRRVFLLVLHPCRPPPPRRSTTTTMAAATRRTTAAGCSLILG